MNKSIKKLETPCVLVDETILQSNIQSMQDKAKESGVYLRPHIKTHKSLYIGAMQMNAGAIGVTASKVSEALVFMQAGFPSVTVAYPIVDVKKMIRLLTAAKTNYTDLNVICDSREVFQTILEGTEETTYPVSVFLKINVGLNRCGFESNDMDIIKIATAIQESKRTHFKGLLAHAGHVYAAENRLQVRRIAREQALVLHSVKTKLGKSGIGVEMISIGATPTLLSAVSIQGASEIRPGNYVFLDRSALSLDLAKRNEISLSVLATVISENEHYYIIDAGSKTLSSDLGAHGTQNFSGYGLVYPFAEFGTENVEMKILKLSEEHGFVSKLNTYQLKIGEKVWIIPNHACAVMNLAKSFYLHKGKRVIKKLKVDAGRYVL